ncbi:MAG: hypothetical protein KF784_14530 [Fimbriimonadaceae bacterium]|nr:hypothetical protein [Fimbriimonadaceae bacterium]
MRRVLIAIALGVTSLAAAQTPDVFVKLDARINYRTIPEGRSTLRWYDSLGNLSTVALTFTLEPGFTVLFSERLQRLPTGGDPEMLDEYYVEDPGYWRFGKQYLPFGQQRLFRESVSAARVNTTLGSDALPLSIAWCDAKGGRQRGLIGRIGTRIGFSFAVGEHFGISPTTLAVMRDMEDAPGKGRGFRQAFALDLGRKIGLLDAKAEFIAFRDGHHAGDDDLNISDIELSFDPSKYRGITFGWTRNWTDNENTLRAQGRFLVTGNAWVEPLIRLKKGQVFDFSVAFHIRL